MMKTNSEVKDCFLRENQAKFSKGTVRIYKSIINEFFRICNKGYSEISRADIRAWNAALNNKGQETSTIRLKLCCIKSLFKYLIDEDLVKINPIKGIKLPKRNDSIPRYLNKKELAKLTEQVKKSIQMRMVVELLYVTGVRISELLNMQKGDIKWDSRQIWIRKGKGNKERFVLFTPECAERLKVYLNTNSNDTPYIFPNRSGKPLRPKWAQKFFRDCSSNLGFKVTPHMLRHTFAVHLAEKGMPQTYLQELLGHDDINSTKIYTKLYNEARKQKYDSYQ